MNIILEVLVLILHVLWDILYAVLKLALPSSLIEKSIAGQRVLVTGAGGGLGFEISTEFARKGAELILWDINGELNSKTASAVEELGAKVHVYKCDVSKREEVYRIAEKVKKEVGEIDILVNNAGIVNGKRLLDIPDDDIIKTIEINSLAHVWTMKAFLPHMKANGHGHVVTIASVAGNFGLVGLSDYCMSKFAAQGFHESIAIETVAEGLTNVKFTLVNPFLITTGMFEGSVLRFPRLIPSLSPEYVGKRVVEAVLANQHVLVMPRHMHLLIYLKSFLPVDTMTRLSIFTGALQSMDRFVGHGKTE